VAGERRLRITRRPADRPARTSRHAT